VRLSFDALQTIFSRKSIGVLDMAAYFAGTLTAFKKGIAKMPIAAAIKNIENWEERLQEVEIAGCRAILRDLSALKKQLQDAEPDGERIRHLMAKLASQTVSISEKADPRHSAQIANLGDMLADATERADADSDEGDHTSKPAATKTKAARGDEDHDADGKFAKGNHAGRPADGGEDPGDSHDRTSKNDGPSGPRADGDGRDPRPEPRSR
jgi:hypothetical protein